MTILRSRAFRALAASATLLATAAPAIAQQRNWDWSGGRPGDRDYRLVGTGVRALRPELRDTNRGRAFVMLNFDLNRDGLINYREAAEANRVFVSVARPDRGRFDGSSRDEVVARQDNRDGWDRGAMRDYRFRETPQGATMSLREDVLFQTDSANLRPGAIEKLRPLAGYLRANEGVRVAIIGHTDARGTDAHNQSLSERRAESVRTAFDDMGVTRARFRVEGHGEREPVATNNTAEGMRLNRRVDVTLLGQRTEALYRE
jgi:outer membrane protein OmpA-like peptidoglycan-associated protein